MLYQEKTSQPNAAEWQKLYALASQVYTLAPWQWMWDMDIFVVSDPLSQDKLYCSVMGRNGEHFAVGCYLGARGFYGLETIARLDNDPQTYRAMDLLSSQDCVKVSFEEPPDMERIDVERARESGQNFGGRLPELRSFLPGFAPWQISREDGKRLAIMLEQLLVVAPRFRRNKKLLDTKDDEQLFCREYDKEKSVWRDTLVDFPIYHPPKIVNPTVSKRAREQATLLEDMGSLPAVWEIDVAYARSPISESNKVRPFFPKVALCVDHESGYVYKPQIFALRENESEAVVKSIIAATHEAGGVPTKIFVADEFVAELVSELVTKCQSQVILVDDLPAAGAAWEGMDEFFSGG